MKNRQIITNNDRSLANAQKNWMSSADERQADYKAINEARAKGLPWEGKQGLVKMTRAEALIAIAEMESDYSVTEIATDRYLKNRYAGLKWAARRNFKPEGVSDAQIEKRNNTAEAVAEAIEDGKTWERKDDLVKMSSSVAERKMNKMIKEYGIGVIKNNAYLTARYQRLVWVAKR